MEKKIVLEGSPSEKTSAVLAISERPTDRLILLCHGFMSSKESSTNRALTERLLPQNIATLRFDLFGHGESDGPFEKLTLSRCLSQAERLLTWCKENGYLQIGLVGSSFGGLVAIHVAAKYPELFAIALKCPVSDYPPIWRARLGEGGMAFWKKSGMLSFSTPEGKARLEYSFYEDLLKYNTYRDAAQIQSPTLILHGEADEYVPFDQSLRLFDTLRLTHDRKKMEAIPGADHAFSKPEDFEKMIEQITEWIAR
jgi:pimeloyl-ACP methyl ester carboxylesterase